ncbi:hypothetical protein RN001_009037 [Aquatica leii]|uniref:Uncharacterized protein n=1 Tax=Aquatica leii TaxID=1421715 RepID=A0AAN7P840_9COLE|nr:hypothetical protein RN001_009037 [Aquatica leii]
MFKLVALFALLAVANAGVISHGDYGHGDNGHGHVYVHAAPAQHHSHAESYANHNSVSVHPVKVTIAHAAPAHHAVYAAPAHHVVHAAPVAHVAVGHGYGHHGHHGSY